MSEALDTAAARRAAVKFTLGNGAAGWGPAGPQRRWWQKGRKIVAGAGVGVAPPGVGLGRVALGLGVRVPAVGVGSPGVAGVVAPAVGVGSPGVGEPAVGVGPTGRPVSRSR
jgi:hypothetical protein